MLSREQGGEPEDFRALREALHRAEPGLDVRVDARVQGPGLGGRCRFAAAMVRQVWSVAGARAVVVDTYSPVVSAVRWGSRVRVLQIWHALGALKRFGWDSVGLPGGRPVGLARAMRMHRGYDLVAASSERCRGPYSSAFALAADQVVVAPLPRVDRLRDPAWRAQTRARVLAAHPEWADAPVVVYAPTLHREKHSAADAGALVEEAARHGLVVVHAPHPLDVARGEGFSTVDLLCVASAFATDYSSAVFEAALLGIPCYFLAPDLAEYERDRGVYLDYRSDMPGPVVSSPGALVAAVVRGDADAGAAQAFAHQWVAAPQPGTEPSRYPCADHLAGIVRGMLDAG
jgi:CDP-glycerol glycerophosphotransferase (TagB/SpsB family)